MPRVGVGSGIGMVRKGAGSSATVPGTMSAPTLTQIDRTSMTHQQAAAPSTGGSPITSYDLRWSADPTFATGVTTVTGIASPATVTGLTAGTVYYMQTRANNAVGSAAWSASASKDTVFDYSLYNEAGSTTISAADLPGMRVNIGAGYVSLTAAGVTVQQDVAGELLLTFASSGDATAARTNGIHFEQQIPSEPYSAGDTVVTADTTGTSIKGLHYNELIAGTPRTLQNSPQPGFPIVPTRELSPVTG